MKKIMVLCLIFISSILFASDEVKYDKQKEYIIVTDKSKDEMFSYIKTWIIQCFETDIQDDKDMLSKELKTTNLVFGNLSNNLNQSEDDAIFLYKILDENKDLNSVSFKMVNYYIDTHIKGFNYFFLDFICKIDLKDNKYKVSFSNILFKRIDRNGRGKVIWIKNLDTVSISQLEKIEKLLETIADKFKIVLNANNEDW